MFLFDLLNMNKKHHLLKIRVHTILSETKMNIEIVPYTKY